jgi:hypothetical protein
MVYLQDFTNNLTSWLHREKKAAEEFYHSRGKIVSESSLKHSTVKILLPCFICLNQLKSWKEQPNKQVS